MPTVVGDARGRLVAIAGHHARVVQTRARARAAIARADVGFTVSATTSTPRRRTAPARKDDRVALAASPLGLGGEIRGNHTDELGAADAHLAPSTTPRAPRPAFVLEGARRDELDAPLARRGRDRARDRVLRRVLDRAGATEQRRLVDACGRDDVDEPHPTLGDGARLVEHDGVDRARRLEHLAALDHDARAARRARCRP